MAISATYEALSHIALTEFGDIVVKAEIQRLPTGDPRKVRLHLIDKYLYRQVPLSTFLFP